MRARKVRDFMRFFPNGLKLKGIELRDLQIIARLGSTEALKNPYLLEMK